MKIMMTKMMTKLKMEKTLRKININYMTKQKKMIKKLMNIEYMMMKSILSIKADKYKNYNVEDVVN